MQFSCLKFNCISKNSDKISGDDGAPKKDDFFDTGKILIYRRVKNILIGFLAVFTVVSLLPSCEQNAGPAGAAPASGAKNTRSLQSVGNGNNSGTNNVNPGAQTDNSSQNFDPNSSGNQQTQQSTSSATAGPVGDPDEIKYVDNLGSLYLTYKQNKFAEDVAFSCPGDSFMLGEKSTFDKDGETKDRIYQFKCGFLQDGTSRPLRKKSCEWSNRTKVKKDVDFKCPDGKFMAGQKSYYVLAEKDREYQYECCQLVNESDDEAVITKVKQNDGTDFTVCSNEEQRVPPQFKNWPDFTPYIHVDVNERIEDFSYSCEKTGILPLGGLSVNFEMIPVENAILNQVRTHFNGQSFDRRHSFYCCSTTFKKTN